MNWCRVIAAVSIGGLIASQSPSRHTALTGTTVVALRTRDAVLIATDSREVQIDPSGRVINVRDDACKMIERNKVVFALAGISRSTRSFDAMATANRVMVPGLSLKEMASRFQRLAEPAIQAELRRWPNTPGETAEGIPGLHYLFAAPQHGVSAMVWGDVAGIRRSDGTIVATTLEHGEWPGPPENVVLFGKTAAIMREQAKGLIGFRTEAQAMLVAKEMIRIEETDPVDGAFVGGDVDIAIVRPDGIVWSQQKAHCRNVGR